MIVHSDYPMDSGSQRLLQCFSKNFIYPTPNAALCPIGDAKLE